LKHRQQHQSTNQQTSFSWVMACKLAELHLLWMMLSRKSLKSSVRFASVSDRGNLSVTHGRSGTCAKKPCKLFPRKTFGVSHSNTWLLCRGLFVCFLLLLLQFSHFHWLFAVHLGLHEAI
jgi:hypothetical protein